MMSTSNRSDEREVIARTLELRPLSVQNSQSPAIEMLSDDVLLEIFDLCLFNEEDINPWYDYGCGVVDEAWYDAWYVLVHVCQRWRYVVFASPRRLNLRLNCSGRRVREMLGVWSALPIVIWEGDDDNIIATLEHRDRVCEIKLRGLTRLQSENLIPLMQESFPALTKLQIEAAHDELLVLPDSFLDGSVPHLRFLCLRSISFPEFPNLLLSASNLVDLYLDGAPSGYIPPEMVAALSALTKLELMHISFRHPASDSDLRIPGPPPLTRSLLPALKALELRGDGQYLDDFVARIDVPSLKNLTIVFSTRPVIVDDFFHLPQLIGRVEEYRSSDFVRFDLSPHAMGVTLGMRSWTSDTFPGTLELRFLCGTTDGPLPSLVDACNASLIPLSNIETFQITSSLSYRYAQCGLNMGPPKWLQVLRQFSPAKKLYLGSPEFLPPVAFALKQVIEEGTTDVLPSIQELSVFRSPSAGPVREAFEQFATARGLCFRDQAGSLSSWRISPRPTGFL